MFPEIHSRTPGSLTSGTFYFANVLSNVTLPSHVDRCRYSIKAKAVVNHSLYMEMLLFCESFKQ